MQTKSLQEMVEAGYVTMIYDANTDETIIIRKQYDPSTGKEEQPQRECVNRADIDDLIFLRENQLADLQEIRKLFPEKLIA